MLGNKIKELIDITDKYIDSYNVLICELIGKMQSYASICGIKYPDCNDFYTNYKNIINNYDNYNVIQDVEELKNKYYTANIERDNINKLKRVLIEFLKYWNE